MLHVYVSKVTCSGKASRKCLSSTKLNIAEPPKGLRLSSQSFGIPSLLSDERPQFGHCGGASIFAHVQGGRWLDLHAQHPADGHDGHDEARRSHTKSFAPQWRSSFESLGHSKKKVERKHKSFKYSLYGMYQMKHECVISRIPFWDLRICSVNGGFVLQTLDQGGVEKGFSGQIHSKLHDRGYVLTSGGHNSQPF